MVFKKKYKKSEWMEGLLEAERLMKLLGNKEKIYSLLVTDGSQLHFALGVGAYLNYFEENKEILLKTLDK